jgi:hypothetical protein
MSMMGELTFLLGIKVKKMKQDIFVHQAKYIKDFMKKFNMAKAKPMSNLMSMATVLDPDKNGEIVDQREYKSMIGSLLYLTATRSNNQFTVCMCARFQVSPRTSHQQAIQSIFRYLKYTLKFGIWYSASSSLDLVGFFDDNFVGCELIKKVLLVHVIFLVLILFVGHLRNKPLLHNPPQRLSM